MKITFDMTKAAYLAAKDVLEKKISRQEAIDYLAAEVGMSKGSAGDFIANFKYLINGDKYTRTMNGVSTDYFLENIYNDFGSNIYQNAITATSRHVDYYEKLPKGGKLHKIRKIIKKHSEILKSISDQECIFNDDGEFEYQKEVLRSSSSKLPDTPQKKKETKVINGNSIYPRNPSHAKKSLLEANFTCEISSDHKTFIQKFNLKPFTEAHHLIPLKYHNDYPVSLDVPANIISLCPNCHRKIHFWQLEEIEEFLKLLLENRMKRLSKCGIKISLSKLKVLYKS